MYLKPDIKFELDWTLPCWFKGCGYSKEGCYADYKTDDKHFCQLYTELNQLMCSCGIPYSDKYIKKLSPVTDEEFVAYDRINEIRLDMVNFVNEGRNLLITSDHPQTGKTTFSLKLMYRYFFDICDGNGYVRRGYFVHVPDLVDKFRTYDFLSSEEYKELDKILKNVDLVIWDDIISTPFNEREISNIANYIKLRDMNDKANIFNGQNVSKIEDYVKARIAGIIESGEILKLDGPSLKERNEILGLDR